MDRYTYETRFWLDLRFDPDIRAAHGIPYETFQPVHGIADEDWNPELFLMAARWGRLFHQIETLQPESFLDVGGAEGLSAALVGRAFGIETASVDLSAQACLRAREFFDVPSAAVDCARLPFRDDSFDLVFMSEVVEHLAQPVLSLLELKRVARRAVILTTEAFAPDEGARQQELEARRLDLHMDRSIICPDDFLQVFAPWKTLLTNHCALIPDPLPTSSAEVHASVETNLRKHGLEWPAHGLFAVACVDEEPRSPGDGIESTVDRLFALLAPGPRERRPMADGAPVPEKLLNRLSCPVTRGPLVPDPRGLRSPRGQRVFPVLKGVPVLQTQPGERASSSLEERLARDEGEDPRRVTLLLELDRKLVFDLPEATGDSVFLKDDAAAWECPGETTLTLLAGGGVLARCPQADPQIISPRLDRPLAGIKGVTVVARAHSDEPRAETMQLFFRTLMRPAWWEPGSSAAPLPMDGALHTLFFPVPEGAGFPSDDELLSLRLDPAHDPAEIEIHELVIEPAG